MVPADATVFIDNVKVGDKSPLSLDRPPGPYTLSVTRDGYARSDQNVELKAGQPLPLEVRLEPSPDTGFELTSEPPGGLVWLDGAPINGAVGTAGADGLPRVPHPARTSRAGDQGREPVQALAPGRRGRAGRHPQDPRGADPVGGWAASAAGRQSQGRGATAPAGAGDHRRRPRSSHRPAMPAKPGGGAPSAAPARRPTGSTGPDSRRRRRRRRRSASGARRSKNRRRGGRGGRWRQGAVAAPPSAECSITINSVPWSEVWIDGKNTTSTRRRRLQDPLRQAQARVQASRHADRSHREHQRSPGPAFKQVTRWLSKNSGGHVARPHPSRRESPLPLAELAAGTRRCRTLSTRRRRRRRAPRRWRRPGASIHRAAAQAPAAPGGARLSAARSRSSRWRGWCRPTRRCWRSAAARAICSRRCPTGAARASTTCPRWSRARGPATPTSRSRSASDHGPRPAGAGQVREAAAIRWRWAPGTPSSATACATACWTSRRC